MMMLIPGDCRCRPSMEGVGRPFGSVIDTDAWDRAQKPPKSMTRAMEGNIRAARALLLSRLSCADGKPIQGRVWAMVSALREQSRLR